MMSGTSGVENDLKLCEFHGCTFPDGYTCPACQRTDGDLLRIWREVRDLRREVAELKKAIAP